VFFKACALNKGFVVVNFYLFSFAFNSRLLHWWVFCNEGDLIRVRISRRENHAHLFKNVHNFFVFIYSMAKPEMKQNNNKKKYSASFAVLALPFWRHFFVEAYMREKNRNSPATLVTVGKTSFRPSGSCFFFTVDICSIK